MFTHKRFDKEINDALVLSKLKEVANRALAEQDAVFDLPALDLPPLRLPEETTTQGACAS